MHNFVRVDLNEKKKPIALNMRDRNVKRSSKIWISEKHYMIFIKENIIKNLKIVI